MLEFILEIIFQLDKGLKNNLLESLCLEIFIKNSKSVVFACRYCPPDGSKYLVDNYNTLIHDNINKLSNDDKETVIMGDFKACVCYFYHLFLTKS